jgi:Mg2+ and Co2+ transporter CorA
MMSSPKDRDVDARTSYRTTLLHCFRHNGLLNQKGIPHPLQLLLDLYRLVASEWVVVHTYLERDLSTIEWRLENEKNVRLEVLESFLAQLFIFRRRIFKYGRLLHKQLQTILTDHPVSWDDTSGQSSSSTEQIKQLLTADFKHVQQLSNTNASRINQIVAIIIPLISIRDGKAAMAQNRNLGFLTTLATVLLPFNAIAAILAVPRPYGPGGEGFWVFWVASIVVCVVVLVSFLVYRVLFMKKK